MKKPTKKKSRSENADTADTLLLNFLTEPVLTQLKSAALCVRVDLQLKQVRPSELETGRPAFLPTVRYTKPTTEGRFIAAVDAVVPVTVARIRSVDDSRVQTVRATKQAKPKPVSLERAALTATDYVLPDTEPEKVAARLAHRLNGHFFRRRTRRRTNPLKLPALICLHDVGTRRHLHCLFGLPTGIGVNEFKQALRHVLKKEPFVFAGAVDTERAGKIEVVKNLPASVRYNAEPDKSSSRNAVLYTFPRRQPSTTN